MLRHPSRDRRTAHPASRIPHPASRRRSAAARCRHSRRQGVILLVVLGMLALFTIVVLTFVIVARQAQKSAVIFNRAKDYPESYEEHLNEAALQVIRGTLNANSVLGPHSLLEDLYGNDSFIGDISTAATASTGTGGQFIQFEGTVDTGKSLTDLSPVGSYYNGQVLTMIEGDAKGESTRIVGYSHSGTTGTFTMMPFPSGTLPATGEFLINGRPFNGTGFGYSSATYSATDRLLDAMDGGHEVALLPNPVFNPNLEPITPGVPVATTNGGGADEDYDAPDFQNMILAAMAWNSVTGRWEVGAPSLHRPALINYWNTTGGLSSDADWRKVMLRPYTVDHTKFTGSNPKITTAANWKNPDFLGGGTLDGDEKYWDVDNDGNGAPDSVWVDLGVPVATAADGRLYKPLFAILCIDLDGRLNVNAHGSFAHQSQAVNAVANVSDTNFPGTTGSANLPIGLGHGPADVFLKNLLPTTFDELLMGNGTVEGRYGELGAVAQRAGVGNSEDLWNRIKTPDEFWNSVRTGVNDPTLFGSPGDINGDGSIGLDIRGQPRFHQMGEFTGPNNRESYNDDYEMNFAAGRQHQVTSNTSGQLSRVDNPFTLADLEAILRANDVDATALSARLAQLCGADLYDNTNATTINLSAIRRGVLTTDSFDLPTPAVGAQPDLATLAPHGLRPADLIRARLNASGFSGAMNTEVSKLLPAELLLGLRMDINRPFGDGRDNDGDGLVDEPDEAASGVEMAWWRGSDAPPTGLGTSYVDVPLDHNRDGAINAQDGLVRQDYARNLFVLLLALKNSAYNHPTGSETLTTLEQEEMTARRIAQWAINVVDFRDQDSIMTPFEYDVNPFNTDGWAVDGNVGTVDATTDRRVVWGCEEPLLLLTETMAFHDRRVADLATDDGADLNDGLMTTGTLRDDSNSNGMPDDVDMDQPRIPEGSAFFELYCTRRSSASNPTPTAFPQDPSLFTASGDLDLGKKVGGIDPVWRLAISAPRNPIAAAAIPDPSVINDPNSIRERLAETPYTTSFDPTSASLLNPSETVTIERYVWFTDTAPTGHPDADKVYWNQYSNLSPAPPPGEVPLAPGRYVILGPHRHDSSGNRISTRIGSRTTDLREINLNQTGNAAFRVTESNGADYPYGSGDPIGPPLQLSIGANRPGWTGPIGLNVSEPLFSSADYYDPPDDLAGTVIDGVTVLDKYTTAKDQPFDSDAAKNPSFPDGPATGNSEFLRTGTHLDYRAVYLQRLADPTQVYNPAPPAAGYNAALPVNPYMTVDWMPIDLTTFNGEAYDPPGAPNYTNPPVEAMPADPLDGHDPDDPFRGTLAAGATAPHPDTRPAVMFGSRQRGSPHNPSSGVPPKLNSLIWRAESDYPPATPAYAPGVAQPTTSFGPTIANFDLNNHTLGYINQPYHHPSPTIGGPWYDAPGGMGGPEEPFAWLTWNNRPFVSNMELLLVPASSPGRLTYEFSEGGDDADPYYDANVVAPGTVPLPGSFQHLLNFFVTPIGGMTMPPPDYHKLFEYVTVPSRYAGTEDFLDPTVFTTTTTGLAPFYPPNNRVSQFRDPGRVNLNTVFDEGNTLSALLGNQDVVDSSWSGLIWWNQVVRSRRGYGTAAQDEVFRLDNNSPTFFANPFRSFASNYLVPIAGLQHREANTGQPQRSNVEATFLRPEANPPIAPSPGSPTRPLLAFQSNSLVNSTDQNPYFRYQPMQRLGNVLTTRSNVYAIWITMGYFEVTPDTDTTKFPDGYQLLGELGADTGEIKRHRAFFVYDRSIPVAFERGKNHNVHRGLMIKRIIE